ncbi:MAG: GlsB/YeaQ/YmgE family stress response membrane protein [Hyphomicrobium sp.]
MDDKTRAIVVFLIIGIIAGYLASILVGGGGLIQYLVSGVIGAFVGGYLLSALGVNLGIRNALASQIVTSTIGAIVVVLLARLVV